MGSIAPRGLASHRDTWWQQKATVDGFKFLQIELEGADCRQPGGILGPLGRHYLDK